MRKSFIITYLLKKTSHSTTNIFDIFSISPHFLLYCNKKKHSTQEKLKKYFPCIERYEGYWDLVTCTYWHWEKFFICVIFWVYYIIFLAMWPTRKRRLPQLDEEHDGDQQTGLRVQNERAQSDAERWVRYFTFFFSVWTCSVELENLQGYLFNKTGKK